MFKVLRHLIRFVPRLPQQAAFALYNYIIGYVMFYVRSSHEHSQQLVGSALSILWMVVHSVHGIMFKDLKQVFITILYLYISFVSLGTVLRLCTSGASS